MSSVAIPASQRQTPAFEQDAAQASSARTGPPVRFRRLLLARYATVNLVGLVLLGIAWRQGLVAQVWEADSSSLTLVIAGLFLWGMMLGGWRAWKLSDELDRVRGGHVDGKCRAYRDALRRGIDPRVAAEALRTKLLQRVAFAKHLSGVLVTLGLIGTVIGFIIALSGVDPSQVGDAEAIGPMVAKLIDGMGVALYTTLVGASFGMWAAFNHQVLATGAANVYSAILETVSAESDSCSTTTQARYFETS